MRIEDCRETLLKYFDEGTYSSINIHGEFRQSINISLMMTEDCNANCPYCYQSRKNNEISLEVLDSSIDFAYKTFSDKKIRFTLFGGEPTLTFDKIRYVIDKYPMIKFVIVTNGLLLNENKEMADWFCSHKNNIELSLSVGALENIYKEDFLKKINPVINVIKEVGGNIHYVIDKPNKPTIYDEIIHMFQTSVPLVRISIPRHWKDIEANLIVTIDLLKRVADYVYFGKKPMFGRIQWDTVFFSNIYKQEKDLPLEPVPPTFCGCGCMYLAINNKGNIYPCDYFSNSNNFKIGNINNTIDEKSEFFDSMRDWISTVYEDCRDCKLIPDVRLCPKAMCLAENYIINKNPLKPTESHCMANKIEYELYKYISKKSIETGIDVKYKVWKNETA